MVLGLFDDFSYSIKLVNWDGSANVLLDTPTFEFGGWINCYLFP